MASKSETGHARNVANFATLITAVDALGATYNPSKTILTLNALKELKTASEEILAGVNAKFGVSNKAIADRETLFSNLSKLVTRVISALRASDAGPAVIASAGSLVKKLQGRRSSPSKATGDEASEEGGGAGKISSSQMGFDNRIQNFDRFIQFLSNIPEYNPNEEELKITALTDYCHALQETNAIAVEASTNLTNSRIERDRILYSTGTGLVDVALGVKTYVKSIYGTTSPQYKQVSGLSFRNVKK